MQFRSSVWLWIGLCCGVLVVMLVAMVLVIAGFAIAHQESLVDQTTERELSLSSDVESAITRIEVEDPDDLSELDRETPWQSILQDPARHSKYSIFQLSEIVETWWKQDGLSVLDNIFESSVNRSDRDVLANLVLNRAINENYSETFEAALVLTEATKLRTLTKIAKSWGIDDPLKALKAIRDATVLSDFDRVSLERSVIQSWSRSDPKELLTGLGLLPIRLRTFGEQAALEEIAHRSPSQAVQLVQTLSQPDQARVRVLTKLIVKNWIRIDRHKALEWIKSPYVEQLEFRRDVYAVAIEELARTDPGRAMDLALNEPVDLLRGGLESYVLRQVASSDTQLALEMLPRVRSVGRGYLNAFSDVGIALIEEKDFGGVLRLGEEIEEAFRADYFDSLTMRWAQEAPIELLEHIPNFPTGLDRSRAAENLLFVDRVSSSLSLDEIGLAAGYVSSDVLDEMVGNWNLWEGGSMRLPYSATQLGLTEDEYDEFQRVATLIANSLGFPRRL